MKSNRQILLVVLIFLVLVCGIFLRVDGVDNLKSINGESLPKNPDSFYFLRLAETEPGSESLREGFEFLPKEKWWKFEPTHSPVLFPILCFLLLVGAGFIFINYPYWNLEGSLLWVIFMSFSKIIFYRTSVGFYDHDILGMAFFVLLLFSLKIMFPVKKEFNWKGIPLLISSMFLIWFSWGGLYKITILFMWLFYLSLLIFSLVKKDAIRNYLLFGLVACGVFLLIVFKPSTFISENYFSFGTIKSLILFLPVIAFAFWKSFKYKRAGTFSVLLSAMLLLFYSQRAVYISAPLIFLMSAITISQEIKRIPIMKDISVFFFILLAFFLILPMGFSYEKINKWGHEDWENGMVWLKENSLPEDKILSWWENGYYIQYLAERKTISDGGNFVYVENISSYFLTGNYDSILSLDAQYIVIFNRDLFIRENILNYGKEDFKEIENSFLDLLIREDKLEGLQLVYKNNGIRIFKINDNQYAGFTSSE